MTFLPIVERELRVAARRPATYWLRFFAALAAIVVMLLTFGGMNLHRPGAIVAKETFGVLSMLTMVFCLFAGMFQTADSLSSEKREGTLGLLFLTDLRGYDVVLGKLAANSLHACYGLLAVLPVLAIPLLAGGVTAGEFWRVVLVLLAGLFFSLGIGMFVSAVVRETRQSLGFSAFLIIFIAGLLPAIHELLWLLFKIKITAPLLWPSLGYALGRTSDSYYNYRAGFQEFWGSLLTIVAIGLGSLLLASYILPRAWHGKSQSGDASKAGLGWRRARFGGHDRRRSLGELLTANPFHWLAIRDRLSWISFWLLAGAVAPFWVLFLFTVFRTTGPGFARMIPLQFLFFITVGFSLAFKCLVASEASRRLNEDRKSGALELLLVTPLSESDIVAGQRRALRDQFLAPILLMELLFAILLWLFYGSGLLKNLDDEGVFAVIMVGNMIVLLTDFAAMGWVGMWTGLRARQHHRAVLITLLQVLVVPWLLYFLLGVAGFFQASTPVPLFIVWYGLGIANDLIWAKLARAGLKSEFRQFAAGTVLRKPKHDFAATTEYANA